MYAVVNNLLEVQRYTTNRRFACLAALGAKCAVYDIGKDTVFREHIKYDEVDVEAGILEELEKHKQPAKKRRKITSPYQEQFEKLAEEDKRAFFGGVSKAFKNEDAMHIFQGLINPLRPYMDVFRVFEALMRINARTAILFAKWATLSTEYTCVAWNGSSRKAPKWLITMVKMHCFDGASPQSNLFIIYNNSPGTDIYRVTTCLKLYLEGTADQSETFFIWSTVNPVLVFTSS